MTEERDAQKVNLKENLFSFRTLLGLLVAGVVITLFLRNFNLNEALNIIGRARLPYLVLAITVFYLSLPLRGYRWQVIMKPTGQTVKLAPLTQYYFLSWFANAILPARIGDIYRAYLLKKNKNISISQSLGILFSERIFDLAITGILVVLSASLYWSFLKGSDEANYLIWGITLIAVLLGFFLISIKIIPLLAHRFPEKWRHKIMLFSSGLLKSPTLIPAVTILTFLIWLSEALRLYLVFRAFDIDIGFMMALFISQASLLLMSLPLSPAGLGLVELLMLKVLTSIHTTNELAAAITIADRLISYWSLILSGGIVYLMSSRVR